MPIERVTFVSDKKKEFCAVIKFLAKKYLEAMKIHPEMVMM